MSSPCFFASYGLVSLIMSRTDLNDRHILVCMYTEFHPVPSQLRACFRSLSGQERLLCGSSCRLTKSLSSVSFITFSRAAVTLSAIRTSRSYRNQQEFSASRRRWCARDSAVPPSISLLKDRPSSVRLERAYQHYSLLRQSRHRPAC